MGETPPSATLPCLGVEMFTDSWDFSIFADYLAVFLAYPLVSGAFFILIGLAVVEKVIGFLGKVAK